MADIIIKDLDGYNAGDVIYLSEILTFDPDDDNIKLHGMNNHHLEALDSLLISFCVVLKECKVNMIDCDEKKLSDAIGKFSTDLGEIAKLAS